MPREDPSACEQARAAPALCPGDAFREANPRAAAEQGAGAAMCAGLWLPSAAPTDPARSHRRAGAPHGVTFSPSRELSAPGQPWASSGSLYNAGLQNWCRGPGAACS